MTRLPEFETLALGALELWAGAEPEPKVLAATVQKLRRHTGGADLWGDRPGLFARAVRRLLSEGAGSLRASDNLVLAARLSTSSPELDDKALVQREDLLRPLLQHWRGCMHHGFLAPLLWNSAFLAYFLADEQITRAELQAFLNATLDKLESGPTAPLWLEVVTRHRKVLGDEPAADYAAEWLVHESETLEELVEHARIPERSWFWSDLVEDILVRAADESDAEFIRLMPRLLELSKRFPASVDRILAGVVNRYALTETPILHSELLDLLLSRWGSPQLEASDTAFRWSHASENAVLMVSQWLAEEDLRDFFAIIQSSRRTLSQLDQRRLNYWLRFTKRMSATRLVLGRGYEDSTNPDIRKFVAKRKARISWLRDTARENLAILMRMGDYYAVEFAQSGNACYVYHAQDLPFTFRDSFFAAADLRDQGKACARIIHNGTWELKFDETLWGLGIRPNSVAGGNESQPALRRPNVRPDHEDLDPKLVPKLERELSRLEKRTVDNRPKGGSYWIELKGVPSPALVAGMKMAGYRYARGRGFYR